MAQQPAQPSPQLLALTAAYQAQTTAIRDRVSRFVTYLWGSFAVHDDVAQAKYVAEVKPVIVGAQLQMSALTVAFLAHQRQMALGTPFKPVAVDPAKVSGGAVRGGVPMDVVNARPFATTWQQLHDLPRIEASIEKAVKAGERRADSIAATYIQLAKTHAALEVAKSDKRAQYTRRILEGPTSCGLCIVASTAKYHKTELMPIHPGCDCGTEIVYDDAQGLMARQALNRATLQAVHASIEDRFGVSDSAARSIDTSLNGYDVALQYRDVLVTHDHGEIGPVLGVRGQHFTGPADIPAA